MLIGLLAVVVLAGVFYGLQRSRRSPDFIEYAVGAERKQAFVEYFLPLINAENQRIQEDRSRLLALRGRGDLGFIDKGWVRGLAEHYQLEDFEFGSDQHWEDLIARVDVIAISLVLAQSANESGWGTSRFAREANNFFGHWCFQRGCGLVPAARAEGANHEVAVFRSASDSLQRYLLG